MGLVLYNTLTRRKDPFQPLDANNVRMYVCGPTVYDHAHIGNARPVIVFDVLYRLLRHLYGADHVTYVRNITDVDDKINARAAEEKVSIRDLTERTTKQFHDDVKALGCLEPTIEPRATEHIPEMKTLIERLLADGFAYVAEDHVLFEVKRMPDYGRLSGRSTDEMMAGARVEVAPYKKDPMDFVLWKPSKKGEPSWASPGGIETPGRPGWHLECSAMSWKHLGEVFDIHGGGIDLVFPHHENEIAQSRCAFHTPVMARVWMHNGYLQVEGEKMSKSLGNFITINQLLQEWPGDVLRLQMLMTHYRQPLDWTKVRCQEAQEELHDWAKTVGHVFADAKGVKPCMDLIEALSDDLNFPAALTICRDHYSRARKGDDHAIRSLAESVRFLGFQTVDRPGLFATVVSGQNMGPELLAQNHDRVVRLRAAIANNHIATADELIAELQTGDVQVVVHENGRIVLKRGDDMEFTTNVTNLIAARNAARKARDFREADRIRDELAKMGVQLKDAKDPKTGEMTTTWEIAR